MQIYANTCTTHCTASTHHSQNIMSISISYSFKVGLYDGHNILDMIQEELAQSLQSTLPEEGKTHPLPSCLPDLWRMHVSVHKNPVGDIHGSLPHLA